MYFLLILILGLLLAFLNKIFPHAINHMNIPDFFVSVILILLVSMSLFSRNIKLSKIVKDLSLWILIFMILIVGYSYRDATKDIFYEVAGNLVPSLGIQNKDGSIKFKLSKNNHFMIDSKVDGVDINFLLDTGATNVVLTKEDAKKVGFDLDKLKFNSIATTANGISYQALVVIRQIKIGNIIVENVSASISDGGLDTSLLGMSFLQKLKSYNVSGNEIQFYN